MSSQVGCALACDFCATGRLGGIRSLKTWEILAQHRLVAARGRPPGARRGVHGDGRAVAQLRQRDPRGAHPVRPGRAGDRAPRRSRSRRRACVPAIRRFTAEGHRYRLIVSLGAPTSRRAAAADADREPLAAARADGGDARPRRRDAAQRVTLAYVVIGGVNTTPAHARALAALIGGLRVKLNLIDVSDDTGRYRPRRRPRSWRRSATRSTPWARRSSAATRAATTSAPPAARWPATRSGGGESRSTRCGRIAARAEPERLTRRRAASPARRRARGRRAPCR